MEGYEKHLIDDSTSFHVVSDLSRLVCMEKVTEPWASSMVWSFGIRMECVERASHEILGN